MRMGRKGPIVLALLLAAGCAGRGGKGAEDAVDEADRRSVVLPGQGRYYPSEDPRNRAAPERAPVAEPAPIGAPAGPQAEPGRPEPAGAEERVFVQVLATVDPGKAEDLRGSLERRLVLPVRVVRERQVWKVRVGPLADRLAAEAVQARLVGLGYRDAFLVATRED